MAFEIRSQVTWAQLDANGHMANTAYLDVAVDCRMSFFQSMGFGPLEMAKAHLGPVVRRDEVEYFRELHLLQPIRVTLQLDGISDDASRFRLLNEVYGPADHLAARIVTLGGWFDLVARRLVAPPQAMANALGTLERSVHFEVLASSIK